MGRKSSEVASLRLRDEVRRAVLGSGFDRVGFAAAGRARSAERFQHWIRQGRHGSMGYLERSRERRQDPTLVLPGARTVIAAAVHYREAREEPIPAPSPANGLIASYAQGTDYHAVLDDRLKAACGALAERHGGTHRYYADTGPVLEREWAERAGIGWIGKNTCAIDAERGSFFFIGVILTTLEIEPDEPGMDHCGACRLCLDACPTGALVAPHELDARLCISYLTIELRGTLPEDLEPRTGSLVFGCDICQDVCPYNPPRRLRGDATLAPRSENRDPDLEELARLDEEGFRRRFPRSAVRRSRFEGFLRNVIVALGNAGTPRAAAALDQLAGRPDIIQNTTLAATLERARARNPRR